MKRTKYIPYNGSPITLEHLNSIEHDCFSEKERKELLNKCNELLRVMSFKYFNDFVMAEKIFKMGYYAAHISYKEEDWE